MVVILCHRAICISVETVLIHIVGDDHMEFTQGRPFGFEVECVTADGEPTKGQLIFFSVGKYSIVFSTTKSFKVTQLEKDLLTSMPSSS